MASGGTRILAMLEIVNSGATLWCMQHESSIVAFRFV